MSSCIDEFCKKCFEMWPMWLKTSYPDFRCLLNLCFCSCREQKQRSKSKAVYCVIPPFCGARTRTAAQYTARAVAHRHAHCILYVIICIQIVCISNFYIYIYILYTCVCMCSTKPGYSKPSCKLLCFWSLFFGVYFVFQNAFFAQENTITINTINIYKSNSRTTR